MFSLVMPTSIIIMAAALGWVVTLVDLEAMPEVLVELEVVLDLSAAEGVYVLVGDRVLVVAVLLVLALELAAMDAGA